MNVVPFVAIPPLLILTSLILKAVIVSLSSLEKLDETELLTCETLSWEAFHTDQVNFIRIHAFRSCIEQRMYIRGFVQP